MRQVDPTRRDDVEVEPAPEPEPAAVATFHDANSAALARSGDHGEEIRATPQLHPRPEALAGVPAAEITKGTL